MKHVCVSGDLQAKEYRVLERWMRETATLLQGFRYYAPKYSPFKELEVSCVSLLVAAAAAAGYYPIAEYEIWKIDRADRRKRRPGRADLWFVAGDETYSFEFKRAWNVSSDKQLAKCLDEAVNDVGDIPKYESEHAFGGVIAPIFEKSCLERYLRFNADGYTFWVGNQHPDVVFFFKRRGS